jgi:methylglutaconyl-CoA hydratase
MDFKKITFAVSHSVATLTLCRPELRNAFDEDMIAEIDAAFKASDANHEIRVVVLAAAGKAFCAGADLSWMRRMAQFTDAENQRDAMGLANMLQAIYGCSKPVIARVQGDCYAGGMGLVAACDMAVASETAVFCLSEVKLGLIPATIAPYVVRQMGSSAARRYMLTAERFSAGRAAELGLIQLAVPAAELDAVVSQWVEALLQNSPAAMSQAKRLAHDVSESTLNAELIQDTAGRIASIRASKEGREGVSAFLEKRPASWIKASS